MELTDAEPETPEDQSRRHVRDDDHAKYVVDRIREHDERIAKREDQYHAWLAKLDAERAELDTWLADVTAGDRRELEFRYGQLEDYLRTLADGAEKQVTHKLPGCTLVYKPGTPRVEVTDAAGFVEWAKANNRDLLRVPELPAFEVDKNAVKAAIGRTYATTPDGEVFNPFGEVVPGVRIVRTPSYKVEVAPLEVEQ